MSAMRRFSAREGSRLNPIVLDDDDDQLTACSGHNDSPYSSCSSFSEQPILQGYIPSYARGWFKAPEGDSSTMDNDNQLGRPFPANRSEQPIEATGSHSIMREVSPRRNLVNTSARTVVRREQPEIDTFTLEEAKRLDFMKEREQGAYQRASTDKESSGYVAPETRSSSNLVGSARNRYSETDTLSDLSPHTLGSKNTPGQFLDALRNPSAAGSADILKDYEEGMRRRRAAQHQISLPSPITDASNTESVSTTREAGRANIPKYGPASHLFASPFDYPIDNYGEGPSARPAQPAQPAYTPTATSNKRTRMDEDEQDDEYASDNFVDDEFLLRRSTKRRRNGRYTKAVLSLRF
ncbi:hypothetical protein F4775DRAFT_606248 [Biscogniauxia sp. FL1348]|nr:hypothetical protein F4775DRAFT_606248 [Biscogniauxia sp. FL1348]